ncbi:unnamed protein product [Clavelina lepadiformis]|uniref:Kinase n=1 Tax=Clavelina lepadiformis TaxID=159417 RepID=A0ABP0F0K4_CLALP
MSETLSAAASIEEKIVAEKDDIPGKVANRKTLSGGPDGIISQSATPPILPRGCRPLSHQVAGHRYGQGRLGIGMLQYMDGSILKPVQPPPRGEREVRFYRELFDPNCEDPVFLTLRPFLPKLLGIWTPPVPAENPTGAPAYSYLKLEDACRRFRNPSILDIKIGRVAHDPHADEKKRTAMTARYPPLSEIGFQLLGMRIAGPSPNEAVFYGKDYGRTLTKDKIIEGLNLYLSGNLAWKKYIVKAFIQRLEIILSWFESQERFQFYSSSLLLIYEGEFLDGSSDSDEEFIHKYRQLRIPSMPNDTYLATVRKFLSKTLEEELNDRTDTKNEVNENESSKLKPTTTELPGCTANVQNTDKTQMEAAANQDKSSKSTGLQDKGTMGVVRSGHQGDDFAVPGVTSGRESGYSSEAESKLSTRRALDNNRDFVTSLNRRIQESAYDYQKYRFPPDIVDIRMIDFTHVYEEPKSDDNYIYGLRNLLCYLRQVLKTL